ANYLVALNGSNGTSGSPVSVVAGDFNNDGALDLVSADGSASSYYDVTVVLAAEPAAVLSPASINFGNQAEGTSSGPQPATLTNNGNGTLLITSITVTGMNSTDFTQTNNCGVR